MSNRYAKFDAVTKKVVPCDDILEAARDWENTKAVRVDRVGDLVVSTMFLFLNQGDGDAPLWFETMVFGGEYGKHGEDGEHQRRCETYEQALVQHAEAVALCMPPGMPVISRKRLTGGGT